MTRSTQQSIDTIIAQGEAELADGQTIIARFSAEALNKYHARTNSV
ncbi:MAG: hypothetical protein UV19_C0005G0019 [Parcubacteria group bacterium GW2011_GWA2_42_28]|nr:MAG: hypothetical protein UV19_C0005G0019 [Parcubacteria group bacterium GW2011_GWA2_42_28]KKT55147.1 MAG: hypothetical protein UW45_C0009G0019 [Parcubacteria group bacterium GW2011_GWC2_44_22]